MEPELKLTPLESDVLWTLDNHQFYADQKRRIQEDILALNGTNKKIRSLNEQKGAQIAATPRSSSLTPVDVAKLAERQRENERRKLIADRMRKQSHLLDACKKKEENDWELHIKACCQDGQNACKECPFRWRVGNGVCPYATSKAKQVQKVEKALTVKLYDEVGYALAETMCSRAKPLTEKSTSDCSTDSNQNGSPPSDNPRLQPAPPTTQPKQSYRPSIKTKRTVHREAPTVCQGQVAQKQSPCGNRGLSETHNECLPILHLVEERHGDKFSMYPDGKSAESMLAELSHCKDGDQSGQRRYGYKRPYRYKGSEQLQGMGNVEKADMPLNALIAMPHVPFAHNRFAPSFLPPIISSNKIAASYVCRAYR